MFERQIGTIGGIDVRVFELADELGVRNGDVLRATADYDGELANDRHILARGWTTLPHATPRFGTPVTLRPPAAL